MKKTILFFVLIFFAGSVFAQLTMSSSGVVTFTQGFRFGTGVNYAPSNLRFISTSQTYSSFYLRNSSGYVGICKGPSDPYYPLDCGGTVRGTSFITYSDIRFKEDITDIKEDKFTGIYNLMPKEYNLNSEHNYFPENDDALKHKHFGLIAQDIIKIFPELVSEDSTGILSINYIELIPLLIGALKEQQKTIESIQAQLNEKNIKSSESLPDIIENSLSSSLMQNHPNPFSENTVIEFYLADDVKDARIYIYNMNGTQLKNIELYQKGDGNITINAGELQAGMYMYSLVTDGQVIDTKRMILTD